MILLTTPTQIHGKKLVTDLVLRSGSASARNFSPYRGMNAIVENFYNGDTSANFEYLFEKQVDFDADICQPHYTSEDYDEIAESEEFEKTVPYDPSKDPVTFDDYNRRLEDIPGDYLEHYIANLCFTVFKRKNGNGTVQFDLNHRLQPTLISVDDDSVTELADLQLRVDVKEYPESMKSMAIENMPYVLKRLDNLSRYCGVHMISMIGSYLAAKTDNDRRVNSGLSKKTLKKNAVIARGVYKYTADGHVGRIIDVSNKSKKAADMFDWIVGENKDYPSYREDLTNFVQYCQILNIDLVADDLCKYDGAFMDGLIVTTLTPDTQYCQAVFDAIRDSGISTPAVDTDSVIAATMLCFRDLCETDEGLQKVIRDHDSIKLAETTKLAKKLHYIDCLRCTNPPVFPDGEYSWSDGFLHYNGQLVVLNSRTITKQELQIPKCIISELGFVIHIGDTMFIECMTIQCAHQNMCELFISHTDDVNYNDWTYFQ